VKTGRNDPCLCGSGLKYKKCCLLKTAPPGIIPIGLTPGQLVLARAKAFDDGDFSFIYDTYHPDSTFKEQFPDRQEYIHYGGANLTTDFRILQCRILKEESGDNTSRVLFYLDIEYQGKRVESFELSVFFRDQGEWRYHSSQKLERSEFTGPVEEIDWEDFDRVADKIYF